MFDNLSGGEKQRCDIILQFAIRDLLQNYLNYSSNILVLDEIFDGLDKISTNKIIDLITNKLKDVESIFIISHHTDELELPVDSEIKVIKNTNGISEVN
jgi:DNA repair exonuclease SbcCD ATPase subunit